MYFLLLMLSVLLVNVSAVHGDSMISLNEINFGVETEKTSAFVLFAESR